MIFLTLFAQKLEENDHLQIPAFYFFPTILRAKKVRNFCKYFVSTRWFPFLNTFKQCKYTTTTPLEVYNLQRLEKQVVHEKTM